MNMSDFNRFPSRDQETIEWLECYIKAYKKVSPEIVRSLQEARDAIARLPEEKNCGGDI
tara:strand:+ start:47 stop:223 length:177 start_codon:yes stop_codon:yes gene_type:complete